MRARMSEPAGNGRSNGVGYQEVGQWEGWARRGEETMCVCLLATIERFQRNWQYLVSDLVSAHGTTPGRSFV